MFSADLGGVAASSTPSSNDPPFQKVALLLHGDGTNGAQNNTFVDGSTNNFTITRTGNVAQGTFSPFSLAEGQWSNYFDGSGDYLTLPSNAAFSFGTGDFTVEWWQYWNGTQSSYGTLYNNNYSSAPNLTIQTNANVNQYIVYMNGTSTTITESSAASANQWYHYAVVRNGTTVTIYRNGVSTGSTTYSGNVGSSVTTYIGTGGTGPFTITASYLSNFRIVKGTAVYTANFTPPTAPLTAITNTSLLTCQSNRFVDNSSNNFTITPYGDTKVTAFSSFAPSAAYSASTNGGSGYFDGSGDYLTVASNTAFAFGTGDYTVEFLMYPLSITSQRALIDIGNATWQVYTTTSGTISFYNGADRITSSALTNNQWYHVAISRASNSTKMFINGVQAGSTYTDSTNYSGPYGVGIADRFDGALSEYNGYISNLRVIKGTALYTTTFTPPTAPLTAITNTQLLLNCTNAGIFDNAGKNDIETVGNAQISTSVKKYGTGSMYFDGTGDYLVMPPNPDFAFGTGDFTVEGWTYLVTAGDKGLFQQATSNFPATTSNTVALGINNTGTTWQLYAKNTRTVSTATYTLNTWTHFAVVRSGATTTLYINGTSIITLTSDTTNYTGTYFGIGAIYGTPYSLNGYIDDLRITKGVAVYTSNFTPPTQAFPNV